VRSSQNAKLPNVVPKFNLTLLDQYRAIRAGSLVIDNPLTKRTSWLAFVPKWPTRKLENYTRCKRKSSRPTITLVQCSSALTTHNAVRLVFDFIFSPTNLEPRLLNRFSRKMGYSLRVFPQGLCTFQYKKAELSQRWPCDAPNIWVPWNISRVLTISNGYFSRNL